MKLDDKDEEFGKQVGRMLEAAKAIDEHEREGGRIFNLARKLPCPNCLAQDALKFTRTAHHLYFECSTPKCMPPVRANTRGCR